MHTPVQRLKQETSSTDFKRWRAYLKQMEGEITRTEYYLMQIAMYIVSVNLSEKDSEKLSLEDFALSVVGLEEEEKQETLEEHCYRAKSFFNTISRKKQDGN